MEPSTPIGLVWSHQETSGIARRQSVYTCEGKQGLCLSLEMNVAQLTPDVQQTWDLGQKHLKLRGNLDLDKDMPAY